MKLLVVCLSRLSQSREMSVILTKDKRGLYFLGKIPSLPDTQVENLVLKPYGVFSRTNK